LEAVEVLALALVKQQDASPELGSGQVEQQARVERRSWC
jgi:hypothetical protein